MTRFARLVLVALMLMSPAVAVAGPAEDATAVIDRWSAAYTSNDPEAVVKNYWPDAILLGTVSPVISVGTEAISTYFSRLKGTGNKNAIGEKHTIVISENAVVLTGFYEFTGMSEGKPVPRPLLCRSAYPVAELWLGRQYWNSHPPPQTSLTRQWVKVFFRPACWPISTEPPSVGITRR